MPGLLTNGPGPLIMDITIWGNVRSGRPGRNPGKGAGKTRKCVKCGAQMDEGFVFTGGGGNVIRRKGGLVGKALYPKAAVCMTCGEISIYVAEEDLDKLKK